MPAEVPVPPAVAEVPRPLERLEADLVELAGQLAAGTCRFLLLVGEYDAADGWKSWGMASTAAWLSWQCGVGMTAAREQVRVARVMRSYPTVVEAFAAGRLSYSKVRAITRVVTPDTVEMLVMWCEHATAAQIERVVAGTRRVARSQDVKARKSARSLSWRFDDDGSLVGSFRLPPEDAALLLHALEVAKDQLDVPPTEVDEVQRAAQEQTEGPYGIASAEAPATRSRRVSTADALLHLATTYLAGASAEAPAGLPGTGAAERYQLVIHASAEALAQPDDAEDTTSDGATLGGLRVHPATARRLTCACSHRTQHNAATATRRDHPLVRDPLHLGRRTRRVRGTLARAVHDRDHGHCQAPGCTRRTTEIHHIRHWASGGPTCITNLTSLCEHHHWLVHEGGWTIVPRPDRGFDFIDPDHRRIPTTPPVASPTAPLPHNPAIPAGAITGLWDGATLNLNNAIGALFWKQDSVQRDDDNASAEASRRGN